jgi:anti-sigma B factor antagonist
VGPIDLSLATSDLGDGIATVSVRGEVDLATAPQLKEALTDLVDNGAGDVLVDLSETTFIDSTTLGVLMSQARRLRAADGDLVIVCGDRNVRRIFEITLLDRLFEIFDTRAEGIAYLLSTPNHAGLQREPRTREA